jgi:hypothetical protein
VTYSKQLPRTYVPIEVVIDRMRDGEPLRWVSLEMLGMKPEGHLKLALMLGGDRLSDEAWHEIDACCEIAENPEDADGIITYSLR